MIWTAEMFCCQWLRTQQLSHALRYFRFAFERVSCFEILFVFFFSRAERG